MITQRIDELAYADIERLVGQKVPEERVLEYKREASLPCHAKEPTTLCIKRPPRLLLRESPMGSCYRGGTFSNCLRPLLERPRYSFNAWLASCCNNRIIDTARKPDLSWPVVLPQAHHPFVERGYPFLATVPF